MPKQFIDDDICDGYNRGHMIEAIQTDKETQWSKTNYFQVKDLNVVTKIRSLYVLFMQCGKR
jgi:hypothetical protein